jgi:hypothetical protein
MKKLFFALVCCLATSVFAQTQTETNQPEKQSKFDYQFVVNATGKHHGKFLQTDIFRVTYTPTWRLGVVAECGGSLMLSKVDGVKDWDSSTTLGGGLNMRLCTFNDFFGDKTKYAFNLTATMGSTVGNADWNHTYYDCSLSLVPRSTSPWLGINAGYRHCNSHNNAIRNFNSIYLGFIVKL